MDSAFEPNSPSIVDRKFVIPADIIIVRRIRGRLEVNLCDGVIHGNDLTRILRNLSQGSQASPCPRLELRVRPLHRGDPNAQGLAPESSTLHVLGATSWGTPVDRNIQPSRLVPFPTGANAMPQTCRLMERIHHGTFWGYPSRRIARNFLTSIGQVEISHPSLFPRWRILISTCVRSAAHSRNLQVLL